MTRLQRTHAERRNLRKMAMVWCFMANSMLTVDMIPEAAASVMVSAMFIREVLKPSRSWQKGISRVAFWSFDNMYSEPQCYECALADRPPSACAPCPLVLLARTSPLVSC
jgi:hypothetical protein